MICLLHENPFAGVAGSGKHNNWSIATDKGENLFAPGKTPRDNAQFLLFLTAVIKAVDDNQDLLRYSVASAGNDHRLGVIEAPPAIMSIYIGDELEAVLESIKEDKSYANQVGAKLNIDKVHPHRFRRTLATSAIDKGMPIEQVQKLLGHQSIDTTLQYSMVSQNNVKESHRKYIG